MTTQSTTFEVEYADGWGPQWEIVHGDAATFQATGGTGQITVDGTYTAARWVAAGVADTVDLTATCRVSVTAAGDENWYADLWSHLPVSEATDDSAVQGYNLGLTHRSGMLRLVLYKRTTGWILHASMDTQIPYAAMNDYTIRMTTQTISSGRIVRGMVWPAAAAPPDEWMLTWVDTDPLPAGYTGVGAEWYAAGAAGTTAFDVISVTPTLAVCATLDAFNRTVTGGWGASWDIATWISDPEHAGVDGQHGFYGDGTTAEGLFMAQWLGAAPPADQRLSVDVRREMLPAVGSGDDASVMLMARMQATATAGRYRGYLARIVPLGWSNDGIPTLSIHRFDSASQFWEEIAEVTIPPLQVDVWYTLHIQCIGSAPTLILAWWTDASGTILAEVQATDATAAYQYTGTLAVMGRLDGATTLSTLWFDNVRVCGTLSPQRRRGWVI